MSDYAIFELGGKQYKVVPNQALEIDFQGEDEKDIEANLLLLVSDGKLDLGKPFLKEKITLKRVENIKGDKVTTRKFHAKANYRKIIGIRPKLTRVLWSVKNKA